MALVLHDAMTGEGARTWPRVQKASEDGIVVVYVALAIVMLLAVTAVAIDVGNGWQQQRYAQSVADSAALSAAQGLKDTSAQCAGWVAGANCAYEQGFYYAFGSLNLPRPTTGQSCGTNCETYTDVTAKKTVVIYTNWQNNADWVHVRVCWSIPTFFGKAVGVNTLSPCGDATAQVDVVPPSHLTSCTPNDLSTTVNNPIPPGSTTLVATYNSAAPIDPNHVILIGTDSSGNLVKVNSGAGGYALTFGSGNTATITYTFPAGVTSTASLFVTDARGSSCGELAWSSCPVSTHDNFIETNGSGLGIADQGMLRTDSDPDESYTATQLANSALIADADDAVTPGPGQSVGPGATLGATYRDETNINRLKSVLFLNGVQVGATLTQLPITAATPSSNTYQYDMSYTLPASTPNGWNSAFLYFWDEDVNQTGGDCALTQWPFSFTGGSSNISLVQ
ncbi:MAG TPA: Tad domain-containing protein [Acidimicrobiales bacterium]|nr:Tad domain-containing protein [Acidimicrobiales bacterium]